MSLNKLYFSKLKKDFDEEKAPQVEELGYNLVSSIGLLERKIVGITATIQPLPGSPDPIEEDLLTRIKNEIITDKYKGVPVKVRYVGNVIKRGEE